MTIPNRSTETAKTPDQQGSPEGELVITRIFDASRELVFKTWIDPKQAARWDGAARFHHALR
ncbi:MAG: hypothetical protein H0U72_11150 [Nitrosospira sp.]|nr:hypothetical protein [Nitrosospira sp.]